VCLPGRVSVSAVAVACGRKLRCSLLLMMMMGFNISHDNSRDIVGGVDGQRWGDCRHCQYFDFL